MTEVTDADNTALDVIEEVEAAIEAGAVSHEEIETEEVIELTTEDPQDPDA